MSSTVYTHQQVAPGTYAIFHQHVRMFLIEGNDSAVLFDTGNPGGELAQYIKQLTSKPLTVVLSHAHGDHIGAVPQFPFVYLHPADFPLLPKESLGKYLPLCKDQGFELGNRFLEVLEIPGHTPGSIALLDQKNGLLFVGDTLQVGPIYMFMPTCSFEKFIQSMDLLESRSKDFKDVYACHHDMPVSAALIPVLREGAQNMLAGMLRGEEVHPTPTRTMWVYKHKNVSFYGPPVQ